MNILSIISVLSGLYLILLSFVMDTGNLRSSFVFKFLPFVFGCGSIFVGLNISKIITLNI